MLSRLFCNLGLTDKDLKDEDTSAILPYWSGWMIADAPPFARVASLYKLIIPLPGGNFKSLLFLLLKLL